MTSSMYNSILHFNEFGVRKIEETVKEFIKEGKDIADLVLGLKENLFELGRNMLEEILEDMDEYLRGCELRKKDWEIVRKDETGLLTSFGTIRYSRTYFKPKEGGKRQHLVDKIVGIEPHDRVSADVVINAIDEAADSSYRKAGETAAYMDEITKQAVMNKVHSLEIIEPEIKIDKKKDIRILYVEADEDHVALQEKGSKNKEDKYKQNNVMPKLIYVHEGFDYEKSTKKRKVLKDVQYFGGIYKNSEDLWIEVSEYIDKVYNTDSIETIYLSGDGASWIRQGLNWIPKSRFVLDNYHLQKYIKIATAHLDDKSIYQELKDALEWPCKKMLKKVFKKILELTETDTKAKAIKDARRYMLNNWDGIEIKAEKGFEIIGCSAEGHVSHVFSDRLSSRPRGWSRIGVAKMSKLRIFKKNGGNVYDLVMAQKLKEAKTKKHHIQDELIKKLRNSSSKYEGVWNSNLTAIDIGQKTGLYKELRGIIGRCG
ncbi:MAG TPA: ISLre2 family transposase [Clostridiaceae bacterium]|jgi:hypothetical protein|nr:ISLre2 family transposase [Clostridiaceae bacterium]